MKFRFHKLLEWLTTPEQRFNREFFIKHWHSLEQVDAFLSCSPHWKHIPVVHGVQLQALPFFYLNECSYFEKKISTDNQAIFSTDYGMQVFSLMLKRGLCITDDLTVDNGEDDGAYPSLVSLGEFLISSDFSDDFLQQLYRILINHDLKEVETYFMHEKPSSYWSINGSDPHKNYRCFKNLAQITKEKKVFLDLISPDMPSRSAITL